MWLFEPIGLCKHPGRLGGARHERCNVFLLHPGVKVFSSCLLRINVSHPRRHPFYVERSGVNAQSNQKRRDRRCCLLAERRWTVGLGRSCCDGGVRRRRPGNDLDPVHVTPDQGQLQLVALHLQRSGISPVSTKQEDLASLRRARGLKEWNIRLVQDKNTRQSLDTPPGTIFLKQQIRDQRVRGPFSHTPHVEVGGCIFGLVMLSSFDQKQGGGKTNE